MSLEPFLRSNIYLIDKRLNLIPSDITAPQLWHWVNAMSSCHAITVVNYFIIELLLVEEIRDDIIIGFTAELIGTALINKLLYLNKRLEFLLIYWTKVTLLDTSFILENGLLYYKGKLVVLKDENIRTYLIKDIYSQFAIAYPNKVKIRKLV